MFLDLSCVSRLFPMELMNLISQMTIILPLMIMMRMARNKGI